MARREDGGVTPNGIAKASGGPAASRGAAKVVTPLGPAAPCRPVLSPPPGLDLSLRGSSTGSAGTGLPLPCLGPSRQRRGALGGSGAAGLPRARWAGGRGPCPPLLPQATRWRRGASRQGGAGRGRGPSEALPARRLFPGDESLRGQPLR